MGIQLAFYRISHALRNRTVFLPLFLEKYPLKIIACGDQAVLNRSDGTTFYLRNLLDGKTDEVAQQKSSLLQNGNLVQC